ncbi:MULTISPECIES: pyridoxamine 5'-phosphate oxidase family protein [Paenibacillus]|uniref:pyridoxamine 5'-phosphate oxidase family protein n=1 Tax=Paenibacillus TaxID=44249 RepID=UPI0022B8DBD2|nr:pyridoxamine 5'-phosphate oxidase family protein [Paenibacillus caseinilyticus]MCZ8518624.1 pyridoxamine 5'-phosphate oxidase family protein [Paenibacillus caseinilyticus]
MGKSFESILPEHREFISKQRMFFVGSAPLGGEGHVNLSPKGYDAFRILSPNEIAYLDLTGSGNETSAHLQENGRITVMFCAFDGAPNILRLYGKGECVLPGSPAWGRLSPLFGEMPGVRQIIRADVYQVQTSCGYGVPLYRYEGDRETLKKWAEVKGPEGVDAYLREKNTRSLDGLPTPLGDRFREEEGQRSS